MPDDGEPSTGFSAPETFTYISRAVPPGCANAGDAFPDRYTGSLDNFTCDARCAAPPDVVIEPPKRKPDNPENPPTGAE